MSEVAATISFSFYLFEVNYRTTLAASLNEVKATDTQSENCIIGVSQWSWKSIDWSRKTENGITAFRYTTGKLWGIFPIDEYFYLTKVE